MKSVWSESYKPNKNKDKLDIQEADVVIIGGGCKNEYTILCNKH